MVVYLLIICVAFYAVTTSLIRLVGDYLFEQKVREEQRVASELAPQMANAYATLTTDALYDHMLQASETLRVRLMILDLYGVAQADTASQLNGISLPIAELRDVLSGEQSAYGFYRDQWIVGAELGAINGLYIEALWQDSERIGALAVITDARDMNDNLVTIQRRMLSWVLPIAALVILINLLVSRMFTRPITALGAGIAQMTKGNFSNRVIVKGNSEFAQLARAFNMMCERLESLDQTRNQFVSNASHELKTPLSTIKILIETLIYQEDFDPAVQKEFLTDINKEIDRLNQVIGELLTLAHIDSGGSAGVMRAVILNDVVTETAGRLSPLARERGIELEIAFREQLTTAGDQTKLTQMLYNLIDNAIKYTPRGGQVKVELTRSGKRAILRVIDTGIGIPKADHLHIFDRFYRVDRARARETGGTGLGLSIVKQIVALHGGDVQVQSEENKGSTFTVDLPLGGS